MVCAESRLRSFNEYCRCNEQRRPIGNPHQPTTVSEHFLTDHHTANEISLTIRTLGYSMKSSTHFLSLNSELLPDFRRKTLHAFGRERFPDQQSVHFFYGFPKALKNPGGGDVRLGMGLALFDVTYIPSVFIASGSSWKIRPPVRTFCKKETPFWKKGIWYTATYHCGSEIRQKYIMTTD